MADIVYPGEAPAGTIGKDLLPDNVDLFIYKGDYLDIVIEVSDDFGQPLNVTGQTPKVQMRKNYDDPQPIELLNEIITTDGAINKVRIYIPSEISATLEVGDYIWDFQLTKTTPFNGTDYEDVRTYFTGDVTVLNEVTK